MTACARCGEQNRPGARFCDSCGAALAEATRPREVRKTVTVLFCDVVGSTAVGERLDPESLRGVMSEYFDAMRAAIERHGGTVEKFIGDAVMAVFGVPRVHEDDALRAVRAAVDMREALAHLNRQLEEERGVTIQTRTGINTGEVVAGDPAAGQKLVTGDAVNVAARLEQSAGPDEILVGESTFGLVHDAVEAERVEPLTVKGKEAPVGAWKLVAVRPDAEAIARQLESPLIGRDDELAQLTQVFRRATRERTCHLFTVIGPAGIGKSRLAAELQATVAEEARVVRGRCLSYGDGITFWPLVEIANELGDVRKAVASHRDADLIAGRIAAAVGGNGHVSAPEETFWVVRKLFEALARERPLVAVFEDIHWAEPTMLDLIEHLADWTRGSPVFLLCLARPELLDARPGWAGGKLNATSILLEPLSEAESSELVSRLAGIPGLTEEIRSRIVAAAQGNALFLEQMVAMLEERGRVDDLALPPSIQALLAARLDQLGDDERTVIERAAVVGKAFDRASVAELAPDGVAHAVRPHLLALVRKELLRQGEDDDFAFRHDLIRDAAYEGMPKRLRAELHERFADYVERTTGERLAELEEIVGHHLEQAAVYRASLGPTDPHTRALAERAAARLASAGSRAFSRGDMPAAAKLLSRAQDLWGPTSPESAVLAVDLSVALREIRELEREKEVLDRAMTTDAAAADPSLRALLELRLVFARIHTDPSGSYDEDAKAALNAVATFEELRDERGLSEALWTLSYVRFRQERHADAVEVNTRAVAHAERAGDEAVVRKAAAALAAVLLWGPTPADEAIGRCEALLRRVQGSARFEADCLMRLGGLNALVGRFDEGRRVIGRARSLMDEFGMTYLRAHSSDVGALLEWLAGDPAAAARELMARRTALAGTGERIYYVGITADVARYECELGLYEQAARGVRLAEQEVPAAFEHGPGFVPDWASVRGRVLAREGRLDEALRHGEAAVEALDRTDSWLVHGLVCTDVADVMVVAGRVGDARALLERALAAYTRKGVVPAIERSRALLAEVGRAPRVRPPGSRPSSPG